MDDFHFEIAEDQVFEKAIKIHAIAKDIKQVGLRKRKKWVFIEPELASAFGHPHHWKCTDDHRTCQPRLDELFLSSSVITIRVLAMFLKPEPRMTDSDILPDDGSATPAILFH
ncbi:hypothetical protein ACTXT7_011914 [Hymenolepis weldensis]